MSHGLCFDLCWFEDAVSTFLWVKDEKKFILNANVLVFPFLIHSLWFSFISVWKYVFYVLTISCTHIMLLQKNDDVYLSRGLNKNKFMWMHNIK